LAEDVMVSDASWFAEAVNVPSANVVSPMTILYVFSPTTFVEKVIGTTPSSSGSISMMFNP
jgi:hypothetical protein